MEEEKDSFSMDVRLKIVAEQPESAVEARNPFELRRNLKFLGILGDFLGSGVLHVQ